MLHNFPETCHKINLNIIVKHKNEIAVSISETNNLFLLNAANKLNI